MFAFRRIVLASLLFAAAIPAAVADTKLDPDPKLLPKARTLATAKADENFDLGPKTPFPIRFAICALRLTAIREEGRALPVSQADMNAAITASRALAVELKVYSAKISASEAEKSVDADLAKELPETIKFERADVNMLGVTVIKNRNNDRLLGCELMRDWYAAQNGRAGPVAATEQAKIAVLNEEQRAEEKAAAAKLPPAPVAPVYSSSAPVLKPTLYAPAAPKPVAIPAAGIPFAGDDKRDVHVGADTADVAARADFAGRPLWSAMAECADRMELIEVQTHDSTKVQVAGYADQASDLYRLDRGVDKAIATSQVGIERNRLRVRVAAIWDDARARTGQPPLGTWSTTCDGASKQANQYVNRQIAANYARQRAAWEARQRTLEAERNNAAISAPSSSISTSSGYSGGSVYAPPSSSGSSSKSQDEHGATMDRYKYENQQIRNDIKAFDRKYGR